MSKKSVGIVLIALFIATATWASTPYQPPEGGDQWQSVNVTLKGTSIDRDATGKAVLACNMAETSHRIQLAAKKLVANGVYSVWLVKYNAAGKKIVRQARVDNSARRLKADKYGKLAFASNLKACPQGKYTHIQVRYHADGNPKNVKAAKTALSGKMP